MSQEFKLVPVEPTREMLNGVCMHPDLARSLWSSMIKHTPQPPALGGEPEVLGYRYDSPSAQDVSPVLHNAQVVAVDGEDDWIERALIDRASLAPYQAEIERLTMACEAHMEVARSRLLTQKRAHSDLQKAQARVAELEGLLREARPAPDEVSIDPQLWERVDAALRPTEGAQS